MNTTGYLDEDELTLYALQLLSSAEESKVEAQLSESSADRRRLAEVRLLLGLYAEATVETQDVPAESLSRLMRSIQKEKAVLPMPVQSAAISSPQSKSVGSKVLPWMGWAIAATLLVVVGWQHERSANLNNAVQTQASLTRQTAEEAATAAHERDTVRDQLQQQKQKAEASQAEVASVKDESEDLRAKVAGEAAKAQKASARAGNLATIAEANARERDALRDTVAAQAEQVQQLNAQATSASQVLQALTDRRALRVALTVPKQKPAPSGHGTYVASNGTLIFTASHLEPLRADKVYQLWLMPSNGGSPIPAGVFTPDASGNASIVSNHFQREIAAKGFAVTIENAGGSQKPTMPLVLAGA